VLWSQIFHWKIALVIVKPETLIGWHRKGFKAFWKWKSRVGRPRLPESLRKLIVRMALEKLLGGQGPAEIALRNWPSPKKNPISPQGRHRLTTTRVSAVKTGASRLRVAVLKNSIRLYNVNTRFFMF